MTKYRKGKEVVLVFLSVKTVALDKKHYMLNLHLKSSYPTFPIYKNITWLTG